MGLQYLEVALAVKMESGVYILQTPPSIHHCALGTQGLGTCKVAAYETGGDGRAQLCDCRQRGYSLFLYYSVLKKEGKHWQEMCLRVAVSYLAAVKSSDWYEQYYYCYCSRCGTVDTGNTE